jgi:hypothetical protein
VVDNVTVAFLQGLKDTGYIEGQNVAVEKFSGCARLQPISSAAA